MVTEGMLISVGVAFTIAIPQRYTTVGSFERLIMSIMKLWGMGAVVVAKQSNKMMD